MAARAAYRGGGQSHCLRPVPTSLSALATRIRPRSPLARTALLALALTAPFVRGCHPHTVSLVHPKAFVRFIRDMPLEEEPLVLAPNEIELLIPSGTVNDVIRGSDVRYPVPLSLGCGLWTDLKPGPLHPSHPNPRRAKLSPVCFQQYAEQSTQMRGSGLAGGAVSSERSELLHELRHHADKPRRGGGRQRGRTTPWSFFGSSFSESFSDTDRPQPPSLSAKPSSAYTESDATSYTMGGDSGGEDAEGHREDEDEEEPRSGWPFTSGGTVRPVQVTALRVPFASFAGFLSTGTGTGASTAPFSRPHAGRFSRCGSLFSSHDDSLRSPLALVLKASDRTGDRTVFDGDLMRTLLHFKWQRYGETLFRVEFVLYLVYLAASTVFALSYVQCLSIDHSIVCAHCRDADVNRSLVCHTAAAHTLERNLLGVELQAPMPVRTPWAKLLSTDGSLADYSGVLTLTYSALIIPFLGGAVVASLSGLTLLALALVTCAAFALASTLDTLSPTLLANALGLLTLALLLKMALLLRHGAGGQRAGLGNLRGGETYGWRLLSLGLQVVVWAARMLLNPAHADGAPKRWVPLMRNVLGAQLTLAYWWCIYYAAFFCGRSNDVFSGFGGLWLVRAFQQVVAEIAAFVSLLFVLMLGFGVGLSIMLHGNQGDFGDALHALFAVLNYALFSEFGDFFTVFSTPNWAGDPASYELNWVAAGMFQLMMLLVQMISLNLLIAIMNDSYEKVRLEAVLEARREQVSWPRAMEPREESPKDGPHPLKTKQGGGEGGCPKSGRQRVEPQAPQLGAPTKTWSPPLWLNA